MIKIDGCDYIDEGGKIFITSDLHLCHDRDFLYAPRGFNSIEEHDEAIIKLWNEIVEEKDTVFILGDLMLNDNVSGINKLKKLNGYLFIVAGNHDNNSRIQLYQDELLWKIDSVQYAYRLKYKGYNFFLTHYPTITGNFDDEKPATKKVWNIAGHSHTKNKYKDIQYNCYHAELDAHNNHPVNIENIIEDIKFYTSLDKYAQLNLSNSHI